MKPKTKKTIETIIIFIVLLAVAPTCIRMILDDPCLGNCGTKSVEIPND